jgi:hypothetical protein
MNVGGGIDFLGKLVDALSRAARWDSGPYPGSWTDRMDDREAGKGLNLLTAIPTEVHGARAGLSGGRDRLVNVAALK